MKRIALFLSLILSVINCFAQTQIDPTYQIQWNLLSGSGAPSISCTQNGNYTVYPYGAQWGQSYQDTTNNVEYKCTTSGWVQNLPTTGGTLTGSLNGTSASFSGTVAAGTIGPAVQAAQQAGTDFGQKVANCMTAAIANGSYVCDARGLNGAQSLSGNLVFNGTNASHVTLLLAGNLTVTQGTNQVLIETAATTGTACGVGNPCLVGLKIVCDGAWSGPVSGPLTNYGGCFFTYSGTDYAWKFPGDTTGVTFANHITIEDIGIQNTNDAANGVMYLGTGYQQVNLVRPTLRLDDGAVGHGIDAFACGTVDGVICTSPGTNSTSAFLKIDAPEISGGAAGIVLTDAVNNGLGWGQSSVFGGRIQAGGRTWNTTSTLGHVTLTSSGVGSGYTVGDVLTVAQGANTTGKVAVLYVNGTGGVTGLTGVGGTLGTGYTVGTNLSTTGGTGTLATVNIVSLGTQNYLTTMGGTVPGNICVDQQNGELAMVGADLENCDVGLRIKDSSTVHPYVHPDGCCVNMGVLLDGTRAYANVVTASGGSTRNAEINGAAKNNIITTSNMVFSDLGASGQNVWNYNYADAPVNQILASGATTPQYANLFFGDGSSGILTNYWQLSKGVTNNFALTDVANTTTVMSFTKGGGAAFNASGVGQFAVTGYSVFNGNGLGGSTFSNNADATFNFDIGSGKTAPQYTSLRFTDWSSGSVVPKWSWTKGSSNVLSLSDSVESGTPFATGPNGASYNTVIQAHGTGVVAFNYSDGTGGVNFGSGASSNTASVSAAGKGTFNGVVATGAAPTVSAAQIGYGSTTVAATNCGSLSGAVGCIVVNIAGTVHYVPYW